MAVRLRKVLWVSTALVGLTGLAGVGSLAGLFWYHGRELADLDADKLRAYRPAQITRIYARDGETLIGEVYSERRTLVGLSAVPLAVRQAFLAAEDADFYHHHGLDFWGMTRALVANVRAGRLTQGASTITQQVVKNFLLSPERTLKRKVQELVLARRVEDALGKDKILELYLNGIYFGHGAYGVQEAARLYFGRSVDELDIGQAALLAALPKAPSSATPHKNPQRAKERQVYVLRQLVAKGFADAATIEPYLEKPLGVVPLQEARTVVSGAEEFADRARAFLLARYGQKDLDTLGARVITTVNMGVQSAAKRAVMSSVIELDRRQGYGRATTAANEARQRELAQEAGTTPVAGQVVPAIVVERPAELTAAPSGVAVKVGSVQAFLPVPPGSRYDDDKLTTDAQFVPGGVVMVKLRQATQADGLPASWWTGELASGPEAAFVLTDVNTAEVVAMVGGTTYQSGGLNRVSQARRQPGSSFKPFVYGAALASRRFSAASLVSDSPQIYEKWRPTNYEVDTYRGDVRLRSALTHSVNTVAIKLTDEIGPAAVVAFAQAAGIDSELRPDLSLALGTSEVTPLELAQAYTTLARGGDKLELSFLLAIETPDGGVWQPPRQSKRALDQDVVFVLTSLMQSVTRAGTAAAAAKLGFPIAGKTGTSAEVRDAWFAGFSRNYAGVAWVGFDQPKPLGKKENGGKSALPIFARVFAQIHAGQPAVDFVPTPGVTIRTIDARSGLLAPPEGLAQATVSKTPDIEAGYFEEYFIAGTEPKDYASAEGASAQDALLEQYGDTVNPSAVPVPNHAQPAAQRSGLPDLD